MSAAAALLASIISAAAIVIIVVRGEVRVGLWSGARDVAGAGADWCAREARERGQAPRGRLEGRIPALGATARLECRRQHHSIDGSVALPLLVISIIGDVAGSP